MGKILLGLVCLLASAGAAFGPASAQDEEERSTVIRFVEEQLSAPNRQIRLNGLRGSLSSNVSLSSITISDDQGVWLKIEEPQLVWNRSALLIGRLEIESLTADRIDYLRNPAPSEATPAPEAGSLRIPELPVAVKLEKLSVPSVHFGPTVFGLEAEAGVEGRVVLDGGSLDLDLDIQRLDGPGGSLKALAKYDGGAKTLALDVQLREPGDGIVAALLNLESRPPVALSIKGDAPIEDLRVALAFDVDGKSVLAGDLVLRDGPSGLQAQAELGGPLQTILPQSQRVFFGDTSQLSAAMLFPPAGGFILESASLESGSLRLTADAATLSDGFPKSLNLDFRLVPNRDGRVVLPVQYGARSLADARLSLHYDADRNDRWEGRFTLRDLRSPDLSVMDVNLVAAGAVTDIRDAAKRSLSFDLNGAVSGIAASDPALAAALGKTIGLAVNGGWTSGAPLQLALLQMTGETFNANASGSVSDLTFDGEIALNASDLTAFFALAGRDLGGGLSLTTVGTVLPLSGGFDLTVDGAAQSLSIGDDRLDPLLTGRTVLTGGVARTPEGLAFRDFHLSNPQMQADINGRFASDLADLKANARIKDLSVVSPRTSGLLEMDLELTGTQTPFDATAILRLSGGALADRRVDALTARFDGRTDGKELSGALTADGAIGTEPVSLAADLDALSDTFGVSNLTARIGATALSGSVQRGADGLIQADLTVDSDDIGGAAALLLAEASGALDGKVRLFADENGAQSASADVTARGLVYADTRIGGADIKAAITDLFGAPKIDAHLDGRNIVAAGIAISTVQANVTTENAVTRFDANAALATHATRIEASGQAVQEAGGTEVTLSTLGLTSDIANARLSGPARLRLENGAVQVSDILLSVGNGTIRVDGSAGQSLDIAVAIANLPLKIANAVRPDLGAAGTISGDIRVTGPAADPMASLSLSGSDVSARAVAEAGLAPLAVSVKARYGDGTVTVETARASNSQNVDVTASGTVPLQGKGLRLKVEGSAPLAVAQPLLASRGASVSGTARFNVTASGSLADPRAEGLLSVDGGSITDPLSNVKLTGITLAAGLSGDRISIRTLRAGLDSGGALSGSGSIGLSPLLPADLSLTLTDARYTDGQTFSATISGKLAISGNLLRDPLLSGTLELAKAEIIVPESFASESNLLTVTHVAPSQKTARTLARIARASPAPTPNARPSIVRLDITVNAPNRIFVRGRGLDAELGGTIRVTGPVTNVVPVGRFELRRGRLSILGQRIDLDEGSITLTGDLDPVLDILAVTQSGDVEATIRLSGRVSRLDVSFSSTPELPEDEVLARIIFGRSLDDLSPVQIVRLASIAAELTAGNKPSLVDGIRKGIGLDDVDIVQDADGNAAVKAGKYISDNIYLGIQAGSKTEATVNLDITDTLTARGSVDSEGGTAVGVFFEKDY